MPKNRCPRAQPSASPFRTACAHPRCSGWEARTRTRRRRTDGRSGRRARFGETRSLKKATIAQADYDKGQSRSSGPTLRARCDLYQISGKPGKTSERFQHENVTDRRRCAGARTHRRPTGARRRIRLNQHRAGRLRREMSSIELTEYARGGGKNEKDPPRPCLGPKP